MNSNATNSFSSFLKFIKKTKSDYECAEKPIRSPSPKMFRSPVIGRHRTPSFDSAFEENTQEDINNELNDLDSKKFKKLHNKVRRKSLSRKHLAVYNNDDILHNAILVENVELTRQVLTTEDIDVNLCKASGWTALHYACKLGNVELLKLLLDSGANINPLTVEGYSPLRLAVLHGNFDAAFYLIHEGGVSCEEIRDGFQERKPYAFISTTGSIMKHARIVKTKSID